MTKQTKATKEKIKLEKIAFSYLNNRVIKEYWYDIDNKEDLYITVTEKEYERHYLVNDDLKDFILYKFYVAYDEILSKNIALNIISIIKIKCIQARGYKVYSRIANTENGVIYYYLKNNNNEVVEIDNRKISIKQLPSDIKIIAHQSLREQCAPNFKNSNIHLLKEVANCGDREDFILIATYLAYCMQAKAPFPILNIYGETGSGKSELCNKLVSLIDPNVTPSLTLSKSESRMYGDATMRSILYFDNLSGINGEISDILCKISTGAGVSLRKYYTTAEVVTINAGAGIILNGIYNTAERPDLIDRSITVNLRHLQSRKSCHKLNEKFEQVKPQILAGLFEMLSHAIVKMDTITISDEENTPRMIDYTRFGTACEEYLGLDEGEFLEIFRRRSNNAVEDSMSNDVVLEAVALVIKDQLDCNDSCKIVYGNLFNLVIKKLDELYPDLHPHVKPRAPNSLSRYINRKIQYLRKTEGLDIVIKRTKKHNALLVTRIIPKSSNIIEVDKLKVGEYYLDEVGNKCFIA
jgi:hypothetical protein